jgi:hypothetical protein
MKEVGDDVGPAFRQQAASSEGMVVLSEEEPGAMTSDHTRKELKTKFLPSINGSSVFNMFLTD